MVYFSAHYNHQKNNKTIHKKLKHSSYFQNIKYIRKSKPYYYDYNGIYDFKYLKHFTGIQIHEFLQILDLINSVISNQHQHKLLVKYAEYQTQ